MRETRRFDEGKGITISMRSKEEQDDYRFIADPDLLELVLDKKFIEDLRKSLPEPPEKKLEKLVKKYHLGKYDSEVLAKNLDIVEFFERVAEKVEPSFAIKLVNV